MIRIAEMERPEQIFRYQQQIAVPYFFAAEYDAWYTSFAQDVDGAGRPLFRELTAKAAFEGDALVGFVQYGKTAFGFDDRGEISSQISYCVIRNLYFDRARPEAGRLLLQQALDAFAPAQTVYAFFHYFGMSCFARHGKLFEQQAHVEALLRQAGFVTEHENVYYASVLCEEEGSAAELRAHPLTAGGQQSFDFLLAGSPVGGGEVHFVNEQTAYLRWIYVNETQTGQGVGTACMKALKRWLAEQGITRLDTDTALDNRVAQHYYEKNGFARAGITRSWYRL